MMGRADNRRVSLPGTAGSVAPRATDNNTRCTGTSGDSESPCLRPRIPARPINSRIIKTPHIPAYITFEKFPEKDLDK